MKLVLVVITALAVGGPHTHKPSPMRGVGVRAGHHFVRTGASGRAAFRLRTGRYTFAGPRGCGRLVVNVHRDTRATMRCSIP